MAVTLLEGTGLGVPLDREHAPSANETTASPIPSVRSRIKFDRANVEDPLFRL